MLFWCRKETLKPTNVYAEPDNPLWNPQLPPWKYKGAEEVKTLISKEEANTGEVRVCAVCVLPYKMKY